MEYDHFSGPSKLHKETKKEKNLRNISVLEPFNLILAILFLFSRNIGRWYYASTSGQNVYFTIPGLPGSIWKFILKE